MHEVIDMLKRHAIQVLWQAGHTLGEIAEQMAVGQRTTPCSFAPNSCRQRGGLLRSAPEWMWRRLLRASWSFERSGKLTHQRIAETRLSG